MLVVFFWKHILRQGHGYKSFIWDKFPGRKSEKVGREARKGEMPIKVTINDLVGNVDKYRAQSHWTPLIACFRISHQKLERLVNSSTDFYTIG